MLWILLDTCHREYEATDERRGTQILFHVKKLLNHRNFRGDTEKRNIFTTNHANHANGREIHYSTQRRRGRREEYILTTDCADFRKQAEKRNALFPAKTQGRREYNSIFNTKGRRATKREKNILTGFTGSTG